MEAEDRGMHLEDEGMSQKPKKMPVPLEAGKAKETESPLEPPGGALACQRTDCSPSDHFRLLTSRLLLFSQSCPTLCEPMDCSPPGFPVLHQLPEFAPSSCPLGQ